MKAQHQEIAVCIWLTLGFCWSLTAEGDELDAILRQTTGVYTAIPEGVVTRSLTAGPILGNGEVGVTIGGAPEAQTLYMNRVDFGARALGGVTILAEPGSSPASYRYEQDIRLAKIRSAVTIHGNPTEMHHWVAANKPLSVSRLKNVGKKPVTYTVQTWTRANDKKFLLPTGREAKIPPPEFLPNQTAQEGNVVSAWRQQYTSRGRWSIGRAVLSTRIAGTKKLTSRKGQTSFRLAPGKEVLILTSIVGDGNLASKLLEMQSYRNQGVKLVRSVTPARLKALSDERIAWWRRFWEKSWVNLGDKRMNQFWYGAYYALACSNRSGHEAPGLWGAWVTVDETRWGGSKYCNYNYQAPFYGVFSGNRPELALTYAEDMEWYLPHGRNMARSAGYRGAMFPRTFGWRGCRGPQPKTPAKLAPAKRGLPLDRSIPAFLSINLANHYFYTLDEDYLRRYAYPFLRAVSEFYEDFLEYRDNRYILHSGAREGCVDVNPCMGLGYVLFALRAAVEAGKHMGENPARLAKWQHMIDRMSEFPTTQVDGMTTLKEAEVYGVHRGIKPDQNRVCAGGRGDNPVIMAPVHPGESFNLGSGERWKKIVHNTITYLNSKPETTKRKLPTWDNYCALPQIFTQAARIGWDPDDLYNQLLKKIEKDMHPNLVVHPKWYGGGIEASGAVEAVNSMLLQGHEGILRLFPVWPKSRDAKFVTLRAKYAFLVSSELKDGEVRYVRILSEKGRDCTVQNPWPGKTVTLERGNRRKDKLRGDRLAFKTKPGQTLLLRQ